MASIDVFTCTCWTQLCVLIHVVWLGLLNGIHWQKKEKVYLLPLFINFNHVIVARESVHYKVMIQANISVRGMYREDGIQECY